VKKTQLPTMACISALTVLAQLPTALVAQDGKAAVVASIDSHQAQYGAVAQQIWDFAELGYMGQRTPDFAEVYYYVRNPDAENVRSIFDRVVKAAEGAALGTGTTMDYEIDGGSYALLPNEALGRAMQANLEQVGGVNYDAGETEFANTIRESLGENAPPLSQAAEVSPFMVLPGAIPASTDVGDVSWVVPTVGLSTATWVPGTAAHSWQAIAADGTSIGNKGMIVAAKTIAMTAVDVLTDAELVQSAREEFLQRIGPDFHYVPLQGDIPPPLDYRRNP
jgi:aminobenzoyl-glutamate utilization protein B